MEATSLALSELKAHPVPNSLNYREGFHVLHNAPTRKGQNEFAFNNLHSHQAKHRKNKPFPDNNYYEANGLINMLLGIPSMEPKDLKGAAPKGTYGAKDGNGNEVDPSHTVFPIIKHGTDGLISLIGTGFFIAENGVFLTAKHVLMEVMDEKGVQTHAIALVQFLGGSYLIRPILRCTSHEIADISVGIAAQMTNDETGEPLKNKLLKLTPNLDGIGSRVSTYAYPKSEIKHAEKQELHFYPDFYEGVVQEHYPTGRDKVMLPGPCSQTSMHIHGGASGGPVFTENGLVCGVNSTGYEDDALSFITPVKTIENLLLSGINTPSNSSGQIRVSELIRDKFISYEPENA